MENVTRIVELLKILANDNRLQIVCLLLASPLTVTEIHLQLPHLTQSAVSQHLATLKSHRLLRSEKTGQQVTYHLADERLRALISLLKDQYCQETAL